jgi:hypothetical protein
LVVLVLICIGIHYEALLWASSGLARVPILPRVRVAFAVLVAMIAHVLEVYVFAVGWVIVLKVIGPSLSEVPQEFGDIAYFSFVNYTSLGYGDIVPLGPARLLAGIEALLGLVLLAWTASFTFFEMSEFWTVKPKRESYGASARTGSPAAAAPPASPASSPPAASRRSPAAAS